MIFNQLRIAVRIFIRQVGTKYMGVFPAPDGGVSGIYDHSWGIEMIDMDIVNLNQASLSGFPDHGHRNILQPDGFLSDQPVIRKGGSDGLGILFISYLLC